MAVTKRTRADHDHALYRFFGDDGALLYVGISLQPFARMGQHRTDKSWWGEVAAVTIERHPTRRDVLAAERDAIRREKPRYNVVHTAPHRGRPRKACRFYYYEPSAQRPITVHNVLPREAVGLALTCDRCASTREPTFFMEVPHGEDSAPRSC